MKRLGNIYQSICTMENLRIADMIARQGKLKQAGVISHMQNEEANLLMLCEMLLNKSFRTSQYSNFTIYEPKERKISSLPYFPDRIVHHAIMNVLEPVFTAIYTADTFSCIKGRGIHKAVNKLKHVLKDKEATKYCLKLDIKKFYPSVDNGILKQLLRRKFKDNDLLWLLDEIIDSSVGLPIGNYMSQPFANFYLTGFDHWLKEEKKVKHYFRYSDDIIILASTKEELHRLQKEISHYLKTKLNLDVKYNYQVFLVADHYKAHGRGIDTLGYVFYHEHTRVRKTIKQRCARKLARHKYKPVSKKLQLTIGSYNGWLKHGNCRHLSKKLFTTCFNLKTSESHQQTKDLQEKK